MTLTERSRLEHCHGWQVAVMDKCQCSKDGEKGPYELTTQYLPTGDILLWMSFFIEHAYKCSTLVDEGGLCVQEYIRKRVLDIGTYILESSATVRQTADVFGVSKSTVHKDVTERLPLVNEKLSMEVKHILETNKAERHIRGGEATRKKYQEG